MHTVGLQRGLAVERVLPILAGAQQWPFKLIFGISRVMPAYLADTRERSVHFSRFWNFKARYSWFKPSLENQSWPSWGWMLATPSAWRETGWRGGERERWAEDGGRRSTRLGFVSFVTFAVTDCWQCGWERRRVRINSLNARRSDVSRLSLLLSLQQILQVCCQRTSLIQKSHTAGDLNYKINFFGEKNRLSFSSSNIIIF